MAKGSPRHVAPTPSAGCTLTADPAINHIAYQVLAQNPRRTTKTKGRAMRPGPSSAKNRSHIRSHTLKFVVNQCCEFVPSGAIDRLWELTWR